MCVEYITIDTTYPDVDLFPFPNKLQISSLIKVLTLKSRSWLYINRFPYSLSFPTRQRLVTKEIKSNPNLYQQASNRNCQVQVLTRAADKIRGRKESKRLMKI